MPLLQKTGGMWKVIDTRFDATEPSSQKARDVIQCSGGRKRWEGFAIDNNFAIQCPQWGRDGLSRGMHLYGRASGVSGPPLALVSLLPNSVI